MFGFLRPRKKKGTSPPDDGAWQAAHEAKKAALERVLGPMDDLVGHAPIPFFLGGALDLYYFTRGVPGTGIATMELIATDGSGPKPNDIGTFELVAFTRHRRSGPNHAVTPNARPDSAYDRIERHLAQILNASARYAFKAVLKPGDTCEMPQSEGQPNVCLMLDEYAPNGKRFVINGRRHCLLLYMEVLPRELEEARRSGSAAVLERLKQAGHYPYSDLDRESVV